MPVLLDGVAHSFLGVRVRVEVGCKGELGVVGTEFLEDNFLVTASFVARYNLPDPFLLPILNTFKDFPKPIVLSVRPVIEFLEFPFVRIFDFAFLDLVPFPSAVCVFLPTGLTFLELNVQKIETFVHVCALLVPPVFASAVHYFLDPAASFSAFE